ncbi:type IV secretion system protein [Burkholderia multivorans]|uniref:Conjugal transfer protein TraH n=1 Tax=Burkholderia multivorans TaxID=87883 RepID=A0AB37AQN8_9BURK|nr:type IV secretion system protein [Burkholderia multivorans]PRE43863.1 conjugal transfer protein TraH [Burkholderia multivorans]PRE54666.1 conjugal transfer protein TraH [Burkholderia multivorans]
MEPTIFQFIGQYLDAALNPFISGTVGEVISTFTLFFIGGAAIHLTLLGYSIGWGYVELPFSAFIKTCAKYLFIGALALNAATYSDWVVGSIQSLETGFTSAFAGTGAGTNSTSVYSVVDVVLGKGWGIAADLWERAGNRGITEMGMMFGEYINATIIALATGLIGVPAGGMIIVAKAALTIMLGIGPVFVALLLWPYTSKFFDSWFGQIMAYILRIALVAAVMGLAFKGFDAVINSVDLDSDQNTLFTSLVLITFTLVMFWLMVETNNVAGQLAGGISSAAVTLRGMAQGAMAPVQTAARVINGPSTRRDMQSGMMVTAGRTNHLIAGNTLWNPAYRQHVMQNVGKNWGRASGGKIEGGER